MRHNVLFFGCSLVLSVLVFPHIAQAATTANITATVTVQNVAVTLTTDGTIAYGTLTTSTTKDTTASGTDDTQTVQNSGNIAQDFTVTGQDSANWELADTAGSNQYFHKFCITNCDATPSWTAFNEDAGTSVTTNVAASGTVNVDFQLGTPTSTTNYTQQSVNVTIQTSAT